MATKKTDDKEVVIQKEAVATSAKASGEKSKATAKKAKPKTTKPSKAAETKAVKATAEKPAKAPAAKKPASATAKKATKAAPKVAAAKPAKAAVVKNPVAVKTTKTMAAPIAAKVADSADQQKIKATAASNLKKPKITERKASGEPQASKPVKMYVSAIGRRKTATARVYIKRGKGQFLVNKKPLNKRYVETSNEYHDIIKPLVELDIYSQFDVVVRVNGGGPTGQAGAIRLGIARALDKIELIGLGLEGADHEALLEALPQRPWRQALKEKGLLTRDARIVERKKFGFRKARKKEQYSKR